MKYLSRVPSQEQQEARDAEEERRLLEKVQKEQETKRQEAAAEHLEYLRQGGQTELQKLARQHVRDLLTVAAGRFEVKARDAWTPHFAELAREAAEVAEAAVREWAAGPLAEAEAELGAADAAREAYIRDNESSEPFWRRVLR